jgi:hypothetical protein
MNIFENESGFLGDASVKHLKISFVEFIKQAAEIRTKLGKQGYLLDKYLSYLFETSNEILAYEAASEGFETGGILNGLCSGILSGDPKNTDHPFYNEVKTYIEAHPLRSQERATKVSIYCSVLIEPCLGSMSKEYYERIESSAHDVLDVSDFRKLYDRIVEVLGDEEAMKNLNLLFRQRFLIVTAMAAFLQGITNDLLYSLTYRDSESSKQIFQLLLDEPSLISEGE